MTDSEFTSQKRTGHCVLCTPAPHGNLTEYAKVPMEMEVDGEVVQADVRVCSQHYDVIERCLKIEGGHD